MGSRVIAIFVALVLTLLCGAGWAAHERSGSIATEASVQDAGPSGTFAFLQLPSPAAEAVDADEDSIPEDIEGEGSMDLPDLVQYPADPWVSAPCRFRPAPHRIAIWQAPVLDGLRRPPRRLAAA